MPYLNDQFEAYTLGESNEILDITSKETLKDIALDLAQQSRRLVQILSRELDQVLYDDDDFIQALATTARRSRYSQIQILAHDSTTAVKNGHKLIQLHQRLSSYVHIRKIHYDHRDFNQALLIVDETAFIHRLFADRFEATVNYNDPLAAKQHSITFNEIWQISEPDPQVRRLNI